MPWEHMIIQTDGATIHTECGPMALDIKAFDAGGPRTDMGRQAALQAVSCLEGIAGVWSRLRRPAEDVDFVPEDSLAVRMIDSVLRIGDGDLTPMAAVAGTIADAVADWLVEQGMQRVIVDNGGDLAVRLTPGESVGVGVRTDIRSPAIAHRIRLDDRHPSWGVTTSGLGGRSFTRGIASAVTVVAQKASIADAAATAIANACWVADAAIRQVPAGTLDPGTDIPDVPVTVAVGRLSAKSVERAVARAAARAEGLSGKGLIVGAMVVSGEVAALTGGWEHLMAGLD